MQSMPNQIHLPENLRAVHQPMLASGLRRSPEWSLALKCGMFWSGYRVTALPLRLAAVSPDIARNGLRDEAISGKGQWRGCLELAKWQGNMKSFQCR